jgi:hypothetical protein
MMIEAIAILSVGIGLMYTISTSMRYLLRDEIKEYKKVHKRL